MKVTSTSSVLQLPDRRTTSARMVREMRLLNKFPPNKWNARLRKINRLRETMITGQAYYAGVDAGKEQALRPMFQKFGHRVRAADARWELTEEAAEVRAEEAAIKEEFGEDLND